MNGQQFSQLALRTESQNFRTDIVSPRIIHAAAGIVTETGELLEAIYSDRLDNINVAEEIGDVAWYTALMLDCLGLKWDDIGIPDNSMRAIISTVPLTTYAAKASIQAGRIMDAIKRGLFYAKDLNVAVIIESLARMYDELYGILAQFNVPIEAVWAATINKLKVRYPGKFTEDLAVNRDLEAERKALEAMRA